MRENIKRCMAESEHKKQINVKGITLMVLVITIIVLLILAGIVTELIIGKNGILIKSGKAIESYENSAEKELNDLDKLYSMIQVATNGDSNVNIDMETLSEYINQIVDNKLQNNNVQLEAKIQELQQKNTELETKINNISNNKITYTYTLLAQTTSTTETAVTLSNNDKFSNYKYVVMAVGYTASGSQAYNGLMPVENFKDGRLYISGISEFSGICRYVSDTSCKMYTTKNNAKMYLYGVK